MNSDIPDNLEIHQQLYQDYGTQSTDDLSNIYTSEQNLKIFSDSIRKVLFNTDQEAIKTGADALEAFSTVGCVERVYPLLMQHLDLFYKSFIYKQLMENLTIEQFTSTFNMVSSIFELLSRVFENWSYFNLGGFTLNNISYRFIRERILENEELTCGIISAITSLFSDFRANKTDDSTNQLLFFSIKTIIILKMETELYDAVIPLISIEYSEPLPATSASSFLSGVTAKIRAESARITTAPSEVAKFMLMPVKYCLCQKQLQLSLNKFTGELISETNYQALAVLSTIIADLRDQSLNDQLIEFLSNHSIKAASNAIRRNVAACIPDLVEIYKMFTTWVNTFKISQAEYCIKYFRGCISKFRNRLAYLAARYIHLQIQQNDVSFIPKMRDINIFLNELDTQTYMFACFRQFLGLRMINCYPELSMAESQLVQELRAVFTNDQIDSLLCMHGDFKESFQITKDFMMTDSKIATKIIIVSVERWPPYPHLGLKVDDNIVAIRNKFEIFYKSKIEGRRLAWMDTLETCVFTYQSCNVIASTLQYVALKCMANGEDMESYGIPPENKQEIISSLSRAGLIIRRSGNISFPRMRTARKTMRINTLTISYPECRPEKSDEEIFDEQRPHIESSIMRALKRENELNYSALYRETQDLLKVPLIEKYFVSCLTKLIAYDFVIKGVDKIYRYFPA